MKYIYLLGLLVLMSCGTVKKSSEESVLKDNSTIEIDATKYSNSYTLEPMDLSKPILIGKDTIYNTRVIYNNSKEIIKEKQANNIEFKEEKKTKQVDYSETIKILGNRLIIALIVLFVLYAILKKFTFLK
jgi:hypothetical protein